MPPLIAWALGAIGAALAAKLLSDAHKKANEDLEAVRREPKPGTSLDERANIPTLQRDPKTGQYRPPS
ncbi:MAG TPA: hypothetical protein VNR41_01205 [Xanthobacteraceae bacterium]|jgi:hypothetical protein|nr:hypothetical protein [Xanthobacteraceae bacterium]